MHDSRPDPTYHLTPTYHPCGREVAAGRHSFALVMRAPLRMFIFALRRSTLGRFARDAPPPSGSRHVHRKRPARSIDLSDNLLHQLLRQPRCLSLCPMKSFRTPFQALRRYYRRLRVERGVTSRRLGTTSLPSRIQGADSRLALTKGRALSRRSHSSSLRETPARCMSH
jgi:hypothetical protein